MTHKLTQFLRDISPSDTFVEISTLTHVVTSDIDRVTDVISQNSFENLYVLGCVPHECPTSGDKRRKTTDKDITRKNYTFFDIDIRKQHTSITDEEIQLVALEIIEKLNGSTQFKDWKYVVFSGNGIHIYYIGSLVHINPKYYSSGYASMATTLSKLIGYEADAQCKNTARIGRLPYSHNNKNGGHIQTFIIADQDRYSNIVEDMNTEGAKQNSISLQDAITKIKDYPIKSMCEAFGIQTTNKNEVIINGEVTSAKINEKDNYVHRFSGKEGNGDFIALYQAIFNKSFIDSIDDITTKVFNSSIKRDKEDPKLVVVHKQIERERLKEQRKQAFSIGYDPLDWNTPRMNNSMPLIKPYSYVVIAGETKSGKTTLVFDLSFKNAVKGKKVVYYSLEMTKEQMFDNICRSAAGITPEDERHKLRTLFYPDTKELVFERKRASLTAATNLHVIGKRLGQSSTILSILDHVLENPDIDLLVLDNLDKIDGKPGQDDMARQRDISKLLTYFTTEYNIPVILIHHLRKKTGYKDSGGLRDIDSLSGSSKISHDADLVVFVSRDKTDSGEFVDNDTMVRVMETREFSPLTKLIEFKDGTFVDKF